MSEYNISLQEATQIIREQLTAHQQCLKINLDKQSKGLMNASTDTGRKIQQLEQNIALFETTQQKLYSLAANKQDNLPNSAAAS